MRLHIILTQDQSFQSIFINSRYVENQAFASEKLHQIAILAHAKTF